MLLRSLRRKDRDVSSTATRIYQCLEWLLILLIAAKNSNWRHASQAWSELPLGQTTAKLASHDSLAWQGLLLCIIAIVVLKYEGRSQWLSLLLYVVIFPQMIASRKCASSMTSDSECSHMWAKNVQITVVTYLHASLPFWQPLGSWTPGPDLTIQFLGYILPGEDSLVATITLHVLQLGYSLVGNSLSTIELSLLAHALTSFTLHYVEAIRGQQEVLIAENFLIAFLYGLLIAVFPAIPFLQRNVKLAKVKPQHRWKNLQNQQFKLALYFYAIVAMVILTVVRWLLMQRLDTDPFIFVLTYLFSKPVRLVLVSYWIIIATTGVFVVIHFWGSKPVGGLSGFGENARRLLRHSTENDFHKVSDANDVFFEEEGTVAKRARALDRRRKFFHGLVVVLFLPTINRDPELSYLALSLAFTAFIFEEILRVMVLPPFGVAIHKFLSGFTDQRDKVGHLVVSHLFLLVGVAGPVWLTLTGELEDSIAISPHSRNHEIAMLSGVLTLGAGDAAASIVGKKYGRHKWPGLKKSVEGTFAFILAVLVGGYVAQCLSTAHRIPWFQFTFAVLMTGLMEAVSTQNDNLIIPIYMWCMII